MMNTNTPNTATSQVPSQVADDDRNREGGETIGPRIGSARNPAACCDNPILKWRGTFHNAAIVCVSCGFVLADDGQLIDWHDPEQVAWERDQRNSVTGH